MLPVSCICCGNRDQSFVWIVPNMAKCMAYEPPLRTHYLWRSYNSCKAPESRLEPGSAPSGLEPGLQGDMYNRIALYNNMN